MPLGQVRLKEKAVFRGEQVFHPRQDLYLRQFDPKGKSPYPKLCLTQVLDEEEEPFQQLVFQCLQRHLKHLVT